MSAAIASIWAGTSTLIVSAGSMGRNILAEASQQHTITDATGISFALVVSALVAVSAGAWWVSAKLAKLEAERKRQDRIEKKLKAAIKKLDPTFDDATESE